MFTFQMNMIFIKKLLKKKTIKLNNKYLKSFIFFFQKTIRNPTDKLDKK